MTPENVLAELLDRVTARSHQAVLLSRDDLDCWPDEAVAALQAQQLISKTCPASRAECPGCEEVCVRPVYTVPSSSGASGHFIQCDRRNGGRRVPLDVNFPIKGINGDGLRRPGIFSPDGFTQWVSGIRPFVHGNTPLNQSGGLFCLNSTDFYRFIETPS